MLPIGTLIAVSSNAPTYILNHINNKSSSRLGKIIGYSRDNIKYAIELTEPLIGKFLLSDTSCHGKGRPGHCIYLALNEFIIIKDSDKATDIKITNTVTYGSTGKSKILESINRDQFDESRGIREYLKDARGTFQVCNNSLNISYDNREILLLL